MYYRAQHHLEYGSITYPSDIIIAVIIVIAHIIIIGITFIIVIIITIVIVVIIVIFIIIIDISALPLQQGVRCSSVVRAFAYGAMGHWIDPS